MDIYNLINSKAISNYCREIKHQFNIEEIAVLIYRNKNMSIEEKIGAYKKLLSDYEDKDMVKRRHCKTFNTVKEMITAEITRVESLVNKIKEDDNNTVYSYNYYCEYEDRVSKGKYDDNDIYKTYDEIEKIIYNEIQDDEENEITSFVINKRTISKNYPNVIKAEYKLDENKKLKMINIYNYEDEVDIAQICLDVPVPFQEGDVLMATTDAPFCEGHILNYDKFPFVLDHLITWNKGFKEKVNEGNYDSSDMQGTGYMISKYNKLYCDNIFDYDSWEYFEGKLTGTKRLLKTVSSLMKREIGIDLFVDAYENIKADEQKRKYNLDIYTDEGIGLAGLEVEKDKK